MSASGDDVLASGAWHGQCIVQRFRAPAVIGFYIKCAAMLRVRMKIVVREVFDILLFSCMGQFLLESSGILWFVNYGRGLWSCARRRLWANWKMQQLRWCTHWLVSQLLRKRRSCIQQPKSCLCMTWVAVPRTGYPISPIPVTIRWSPRSHANVLLAWRLLFRCWFLCVPVCKLRLDVLFGAGGYFASPLLLMALLSMTVVGIQEETSCEWEIKLILGRVATVLCISFAVAASYFFKAKICLR